jgi:hypothetical protein
MVVHRVKGFDLQASSRALNGLSAMTVTRPGRWGNPFGIAEVAARFGLESEAAQAKAVVIYGEWIEGLLDPALDPGRAPPTVVELVAELGGRNLACWCKPGTPCHADLLIGLANPTTAPAEKYRSS